MGYATAYDLAHTEDLSVVIIAHLRSNCYPPVPLDWAGPAKEAIANVVAGNGDEPVACPEWCRYKTVPSRALVDALRLQAFVDAQLVFDDPEYWDEEDEEWTVDEVVSSDDEHSTIIHVNRREEVEYEGRGESGE